jgi:hypothetical protein
VLVRTFLLSRSFTVRIHRIGAKEETLVAQDLQEKKDLK